jgi:hypothetical protein
MHIGGSGACRNVQIDLPVAPGYRGRRYDDGRDLAARPRTVRRCDGNMEPGQSSTGAGSEVSFQAGPFTVSLGTTGGSVGIATPLGPGCDTSWTATFGLG